ncbi:MAG: winged helix-turn-helix domain-containing protein, partial [Burkholderiales bacterium]
MDRAAKAVFVFGQFRLDAQERALFRAGTAVPLTPKDIEILLVLVQNSGQTVEKDRLMQEVWPDTFVEESNLTVHVSQLRKALGDSSGESEYIETIPRRGYRFCVPVEEIMEEQPVTLLERRVEKRIIREEIEEVTFDEAEVKSLLAARGAGRLAKLALGLVALLAAAGFLVWRDPFGMRGQGKAWTPPAIETVAVLPMANLTGDASQDFLADSLTESLITELGRTKDLRVISRASVVRYTDRSRPVRDIAGELGADAVIETSLLPSGGRTRVSARMIHGATERTLLSASFDRDGSDVSAVPWEVARAVALEARPAASLQEPNSHHQTRDYETYSLFLKGRHFGNQRKKEALEYFQQAIARDPNFAPAYLGLGETY